MAINSVTSSEPHRARIVEALGRMGPSRIVEIAGAAGMSNGAAFRYCYGMYEKGILSRMTNGNAPVRYCLADGGDYGHCEEGVARRG